MTVIFSNDYDAHVALVADARAFLEEETEPGTIVSDDDVWFEVNERLNADLDYTLNELFAYFGDKRVLFTGTVGRWNGRCPGGKVGEFQDLLYDLLRDCDEVTFYEERGRLYVKGVHHDGSNTMEVRSLTEAGENAWEDWDYGERFNDLSEQQMHERLLKSRRYTKAPQFTKNVWGR